MLGTGYLKIVKIHLEAHSVYVWKRQHQFLQVQLGKYVQVALAETEFLAPTLMKVTFESSIETKL